MTFGLGPRENQRLLEALDQSVDGVLVPDTVRVVRAHALDGQPCGVDPLEGRDRAACVLSGAGLSGRRGDGEVRGKLSMPISLAAWSASGYSPAKKRR